MNSSSKILFKSFVKPFYKENAGFFVFLFTMMFCIVNKVDGAGLYEYHYSLITGMLKSNVFLLLVFFAWLLYVRKYTLFVSDILSNPHYTFLYIFSCLSNTKQFRLFLVTEMWLLLPVILYTGFIAFVGCDQHLYLPVLFVIGYLLALLIVPPVWHIYRFNSLKETKIFSLKDLTGKLRLSSSYTFVLIRFIANEQKMIWAGVKIFTCGVLYLIARNNTVTDYDIATVFLFFNFGILANGVLVYRIRNFEEVYLSFYRGLPVSLIKRLLHYSIFYFISLIPEFVIAAILVPTHLHYADAITFALYGFSLLLLMHNITFIEDFKMKEYLKILLVVFCLQCIFLITVGLVFLYLLFFISAIIIFLNQYYKFERKHKVTSV